MSSQSTIGQGSGVVTLTDIVKTFPTANGTFTAVDGINLRTEPGEFLTLLGPSGCGKTTTLRMVAGFENPTSGRITLDGQDMVRLTPDRRPMSMVFQSYALFPHLSVRDNIAFGLKLLKLPAADMREQVESVLASMDLVNLADRAPNQLSGGQQQRVALARAMVMRPKVLLFDEPLSNLDAKLRVQMRAEIRRVQKRMGITALYVTHDQDEAMSLSDRIVVMNRGRIEQVGTPAEIYRHPATVFVADFIGQANFLDAKLDDLRDGMATVRVLDGDRRTVPMAASAHDATARSVLVRPESLRIEPVTDAHFGGSIGRVQAAVFYGSLVEYEIETQEGTLVVVETDPDPDAVLPEGRLVSVDFESAKGWVLPSGG
ncbi:ABC transporter ATP-binding protein [Luteococcus sanguinis]|uniref:ABC transporter ATP-binding protein n=1 Tax=Luteococcus sanguinis TaxID=174038 RepID=A0ABW1X028_9ACTN